MLFRRTVVLLLVLTLIGVSASPALAATNNSYASGLAQGRMAGGDHETHAFGWSFAWTLTFGLLGGLGSLGYYAASDPSPSTTALLRIDDEGEQYQLGFIEGYKETAGGVVLGRSALGMGAGLLTNLVLFSALANSSSSNDSFSTVPIASMSW